MWEVYLLGNPNKVDFSCCPVWIWAPILFVNVSFHLLNCYWFFLILKKALACKGSKVSAEEVHLTSDASHSNLKNKSWRSRKPRKEE